MTDESTEGVLAAEQDERRRIALFLHDGPVQSLSGVALMLDAVGEFLRRGTTDQAQEVLEERARGLDAELTVEQEDTGTRMLLIVPLDPANL